MHSITHQSELYQRLITALILIPVVVAGLLYAYPLIVWNFAFFLGIALLLEWLVLLGALPEVKRTFFVVILGLVVFNSLFILALQISDAPVDAADADVGSGFLIALGVWLICWTSMFRGMRLCFQRKFFAVLIAVTVLILFVYSALGVYSAYGGVGIVALLTLVWAIDSGAFAIGKLMGSKKLAPAISPNKTVEGLLGGVLGGVLCYFLWASLGSSLFRFEFWWLAVLLLIPPVILGDLFESALKRQAGVKDSGAVFPGHGGLLDRLDSLIAVAPFAFALTLLHN